MTDVRLLVSIPEAGELGMPFVDFLFDRVGPRRGARLMSYIQAWGVVADELQRTPTAEEYAARFRLRPATAYRDQALFREVFAEETPARILDVLWRSARGVGLRHLLSAPIVHSLHAPEYASPVLAWFVATLLDRLPRGAGAHVDRAVSDLAGSRGDRRQEVARAYDLADRAVFVWFGATLALAREDGKNQGLRSLDRIRPFMSEAADYASSTVAEYGLDLYAQPAEAGAAAAASATFAARLSVRARKGDVDCLRLAATSAAAALVAAFAAAAVTDVVGAARETVDELLPSSARATG